MAEETTVEKTWRLMLEGDPDVRRGDQAVMEAAYAEPRLRVLFPFPSHGCLTFHRNSQFPWSNDLPFIAGSASCSVYGPRYSSVLGERLTPKEAAALVVANLPADCGPAYEGPWPPPESPTS
ncbi:DUF6193 family natural product biosynthesis protein [Streptomyces sp. IGB124]|uniref:DUF6193 family natural product biosynthesis protein n=1 Tax=Streptomyces sp. IGB124 TaxID=1519485 RepID=UPI0006AE1D06|nr:DUF6193 family natural product biosynthesis protein [Streptomyces sp. IGB124]KOU65120.1 hypothetical protein ADK96_19020 [Streptomyces sp. IGB124]